MFTPERIKVLVVDDSRGIAELHRTLINLESDMECVGVALSADELEDLVKNYLPDIVLIDLTMPGRDPLLAIDSLVKQAPQVSIIACSGYDSPEVKRRVLEAGSKGLISKHDATDVMLNAIRSVARGGAVS